MKTTISLNSNVAKASALHKRTYEVAHALRDLSKDLSRVVYSLLDDYKALNSPSSLSEEDLQEYENRAKDAEALLTGLNKLKSKMGEIQ